jgi:NADH dehydrogenase
MAASTLPRRRVVIIGGGFGGLACAIELGNADVDVMVIDRRNHNLFQPLLYQVATAALSPADIAEPIRKTLARYKNVKMIMAEVVGVDVAAKAVLLNDASRVPYDQLVIATGSEYNYFGHDDWKEFAPGLKTIHEAREIRHRLLLAFERAERVTDQEEKRSLLTSIVIGGGPTGVEMAGAIFELGRFMVDRDFRDLQPDHLSVLLVEAGPRILAAFPEHLSVYAHAYLRKIGVDVRTDSKVLNITKDGADIDGKFVKAGSIIWGAGVKASAAHLWLGIAGIAGGRIPVNGLLQVQGFTDVFVLGDAAGLAGSDGKLMPGLAQVAKQQGQFLGRYLRSGSSPTATPFVFKNRGNTAVIGRNAAVFDFGSWTMKGRLAWLLWAVVHVYLLINFEKRLLVSIQWIWRYLTRQRGARIIDETVTQAAAVFDKDHEENKRTNDRRAY